MDVKRRNGNKSFLALLLQRGKSQKIKNPQS